MAELNLVLLGPPGSGKGTQGERLNEDLKLPYYATGDILRAAVRDETELGRTAKGYMTTDFQVPRIISEKVDDRRGTFTIEPLDKGFGYTFGNSLRRVLLSSLGGAAITSVRIEGVAHEFSTVPGVKEDVTDIVLNLKDLVVRMAATLGAARYRRPASCGRAAPRPANGPRSRTRPRPPRPPRPARSGTRG